jgi:hypothetical protein
MLLSKTFRASWSIGLAVALLAAVSPGRIARAENIVGDGALSAHLLDAAASEGAIRHLRALQDIASVSGGNRAAGTPGYDRSAEYVTERLKEAGYLVHFEEFDFPFFEERVPPVLLVSFPNGLQEPAPAAAFRTLTNSGSSNVTARLRAVSLGLAEGTPLASASGCRTTDFDEFERGFVALIRRGICTFQTKVENAWAAGAAGVVIMNEGTDGRTDAFLGQLSELAPIPVVGVSYELGRSLDIAARGGANVRLDVNAVTGKRLTRNVRLHSAVQPRLQVANRFTDRISAEGNEGSESTKNPGYNVITRVMAPGHKLKLCGRKLAVSNVDCGVHDLSPSISSQRHPLVCGHTDATLSPPL